MWFHHARRSQQIAKLGQDRVGGVILFEIDNVGLLLEPGLFYRPASRSDRAARGDQAKPTNGHNCGRGRDLCARYIPAREPPS